MAGPKQGEAAAAKPEAIRRYPDLLSEKLRGAALLASDEFFAPKDNLVKASEPVWKEDEYTDRGKWMDGWESRRKRSPGHDWCILRLGCPGTVEAVVVNTAYFKGNYPEYCALEGCRLEGHRAPEELTDADIEWHEILGKSELDGDTQNLFELDQATHRFTHLRFHIYPAGGVARLRVHGEPLPDLSRARRAGEVDLASVTHGARVIGASDMFFGEGGNLLRPGRAVNMGDGWETRRRRDDGHDWVAVELAAESEPREVVVDTEHFKGNYPDRCSVEVCRAPEASDKEVLSEETEWRPLLGESKLHAHTEHRFDALEADEPATHLRLNIYPDGGVARLRVYGTMTEAGWRNELLKRVNVTVPERAREDFLACCASERWAEAMVAGRPYETLEAMQQRAESVWWELGEEDWLEAFAAHPRIGEKDAPEEASEQSADWSEDEQSGTDDVEASVEQRLREANREYYDTFGYIYIVCASGKSAEEMLEILEGRLEHDPDEELPIAAEEQLKITQLRLEKLVTP